MRAVSALILIAAGCLHLALPPAVHAEDEDGSRLRAVYDRGFKLATDDGQRHV